MRTRKPPHARKRGYALIIVLFFSAVSLAALSGALQWTSNNAVLTQRNNDYFQALAAAEAATEKVLSRISRDYQNHGEGLVYSSLGAYATLVPAAGEDPQWTNYAFSDAGGGAGRIHVSRLSAWGYTNLSSQYTGLKGMAATYRVIANATARDASPPIIAALKQELQLAAIPIFQFAIFYSIDLEINPGPEMTINGRVHTNGNLYNEPVSSLIYLADVTAAGEIFPHKSPLDPTVRSTGSIHYEAENDSRVSALTLPIGTNNSPQAIRSVIEIPPDDESLTSAMGKQRYYNKADLVILVSNSTVRATSGAFNHFATTIPWTEISAFVATNVAFYNKREGKTVKAVEIDVGKLKNWSETNLTLRGELARDLSILFVADLRTQTSGTESGVRLINGQTLPSLGLTVAAPNPVYIKGHYNAPAAHLGTTNTTLARPASILGDSVTILSTAWSDGNSSKSLSSRIAASTTVNAALLAGIVPSDGAHYSGGVENFPRFLENWSGKTFTYNGSMVVMFESQIAIAPWGGSDVYSPPKRNWSFDANFMDATKLPPGTPQLVSMIRSSWKILPPNQIL